MAHNVFGYVTLQQSDSLLQYNLLYDYWNDTNTYTQATGTVHTNGTTDQLHGVGSLFLTELTPLPINVEVNYELLTVIAVASDTVATLSIQTHLDNNSIMKILTADQYTYLKDLYLKKIKSLIASYQLITTYCNIPNDVPDNVKNAQIYLAANVFKTNGASTTTQESNVKSYSIGDMSYTYNSSMSLSGNTPYEIFPSQVYELLRPYLKNQKSFATVSTSAR